MLHEPRFWVLALIIAAVFGEGVSLMLDGRRRRLGFVLTIGALAAFVCLFFFWPEIGPSGGSSITTQGGGTGGNFAGGGGGGKGSPGGPGGTYIQNQYNYGGKSEAIASVPFRSEVRSVIFYQGSERFSQFMVEYNSAHGPTISPVPFLMYLQIVNLQDVPSTIEDYSVDVGTGKEGQWVSLIPISLLSGALYWLHPNANVRPGVDIRFSTGVILLWNGVPAEELHYAALLNPTPLFETEVTHSIAAHQTMDGWAAFDWPAGVNIIPFSFRVSVSDSAGAHSSTVVPVPTASRTQLDTKAGSLVTTGVVRDLSPLYLKHYNEP